MPLRIEHKFPSRDTRPKRKRQKKKCDKSNRVPSSGFSSSLALFTDNVYRRCLANGTWALKGNYSMCKAILHEEVRVSCLHVSWLMSPLGRILKVWSLLHGNQKQTKARLVVEDAALLEAYWNIYSKYDFGVCLPADKRAKHHWKYGRLPQSISLRNLLVLIFALQRAFNVTLPQVIEVSLVSNVGGSFKSAYRPAAFSLLKHGFHLKEKKNSSKETTALSSGDVSDSWKPRRKQPVSTLLLWSCCALHFYPFTFFFFHFFYSFFFLFVLAASSCSVSCVVSALFFP